MPYYPPANRNDELKLFEQMITGQSKERILLFEAGGGMGKTTLLAEFARRCSDRVLSAPIDLKGRSTGLHQIFYRLCDALGWDYFPNFASRVEGLSQVTIANNKMIGRVNIQVALQSPDEEERAARREELTLAFFEDLRALQRRILLLFDTFDEAALEIREWLQSSFLAFARRTPDLIVIVAGRQVPAESIEWGDCCVSYRLKPVHEAESWRIYADNIGAKFPSPEWISAFCELLEGHPLKMAEALARHIPEEGWQR